MKKNIILSILISLCLAPVSYAADTVKIVSSTLPSLVLIEIFDDNGKALGQGSGFFVTNNGDIITNNHVANIGNHYIIYTNDNKALEAHLKATYAEQDIALLTTNNTHKFTYKPLTLSKSTPPPGTHVIALGAPSGLMNTVSDGLVSNIKQKEGFPFLQVSCPISPGSSGGPVVNDNGQVVGMSSFILTTGSNLSFCVPSQQIQAFLDKSKTLSPRNPQVLTAQKKNVPIQTSISSKSQPRFVFMLKHDEIRDGYIETYMDISSIKHRGSIISCNLLSKFGEKLSKMFSINGNVAVIQLLSIEINEVTRTSRIIHTEALDEKGITILSDNTITPWTTIKPRTSVNEYLTFLLLSKL